MSFTDPPLLGASRGERNNNPGNIDFDPHIDWVGSLGLELMPPGSVIKPRFCRFDNAEHGIRALAKILRAYVERDGCKTLRAVIARWAPGAENDTDAYVAAVAAETALDPDSALAPDAGDYTEITRAIIRHENGRVIYPDVTIADAVGEAFS